MSINRSGRTLAACLGILLAPLQLGAQDLSTQAEAYPCYSCEGPMGSQHCEFVMFGTGNQACIAQYDELGGICQVRGGICLNILYLRDMVRGDGTVDVERAGACITQLRLAGARRAPVRDLSTFRV